MICNQRLRLFAGMVLALITISCAAIPPPETGGPRASGPPYPVVFTEETQRTEASILAFNRLAQPGSGQAEVQLQPITAAIKSLPPVLNTPLYLPKVGVGVEMNEEETRESLRRFVDDWQVMIGANPAHLSLVERLDRPDGVKVARYEQRPFRFPIRGGYGMLQIEFLPNRALRNLTSSCLPDAERLQAALAPIVPRLTAEEVIKTVRSNEIPATNSGQQINFRVAPSDEVAAAEMVTYVVRSSGRTDALELHVAWEIIVSASPRRFVYVDAVDGKIIGSAVAL
ncbi:MAG: hypothetical protein ACR2LM_01030 [Pyrinomonadaceae bacterium]